MKPRIRTTLTIALGAVALASSGCRKTPSASLNPEPDPAPMKSFSEDLAFLKQHTGAVVLGAGDGRIVVVPEYQARVMTSTTGGEEDLSYGWLNYELIEAGIRSAEETSGTLEEHIHVFGGEERFWLGPEGGQFAIFFKPGSKFEFEDWFTPALIDREPFEAVSVTDSEAVFARDFELHNYSGTRFTGNIERKITVLDSAATAKALDLEELPQGVRAVAYATENMLANRGQEAWQRETGLLSIWILGMYNPGEQTTVVIPFKAGSEEELGPKVNDAYFGKVPTDRLRVEEDVLFFSGDGEHRGKIGITPQRAKGVAGSYDPIRQVLTLVTYNPRDPDLPYVNSMWEHQEEPYSGDVINSYNDGPPEPGAEPLGPFYELETSSPAAELAPGESITHIQRTLHLQGSEEALSPIAERWLGVSLEDIKGALD